MRPSVKVPWISGPWISDVAHAALIDLVEQLREGNVLEVVCWPGFWNSVNNAKQQQDDDDPQGEIPKIGVHRMSLAGNLPAPGGLITCRKSWRLHVPHARNVGVAPSPAKGRRNHEQDVYSTVIS